jgi:hypothetical protein
MDQIGGVDGDACSQVLPSIRVVPDCPRSFKLSPLRSDTPCRADERVRFVCTTEQASTEIRYPQVSQRHGETHGEFNQPEGRGLGADPQLATEVALRAEKGAYPWRI